jgi:monoamine oxidase
MTFRGGNDQFPKAFASRLGDHVRYNSAVTKIQDIGERVTITIAGATADKSQPAQQQLEADRVIIAIPFAALRNIEIAASMPDTKHTIIQKMRYAPVMRIYLQTTTRFWTERKENGSAETDLPIGDVVDHTSTQPGTRGILEAQMYGGRAVYAKSLSDDDRLRFAARDIVRVHPGLEKNYEKGASFAWDETDPYSGGGWCWHAPGEMLPDYPLVAQPHGRLHFAGEHTSTLVSTMEGAILSGQRAAKEVASAT